MLVMRQLCQLSKLFHFQCLLLEVSSFSLFSFSSFSFFFQLFFCIHVVDNLFILVHTHQRLDLTKYKSTSDGIAHTLGEVGPSILLTAISQACCFGIGTAIDMPAVQIFALYATVAIVFNFFLQITAFIAFMTIDHKRQTVSFRCKFNTQHLKTHFYFRWDVQMFSAASASNPICTITQKVFCKFQWKNIVNFSKASKLRIGFQCNFLVNIT